MIILIAVIVTKSSQNVESEIISDLEAWFWDNCHCLDSTLLFEYNINTNETERMLATWDYDTGIVSLIPYTL